ncbi:MAG: DEAD/DEAH box helicase [Mariprofundales bacterium]|nr:DEAD/DEAH box helicase [Mariprofundales bacterium]
MSTNRSKAEKTRKTRKKKDSVPHFVGWLTSDEDEIERRRDRGAKADVAIQALEPERTFFGSFLLTSDSGDSYRVEIRSLTQRCNSCDCPDHRVNGLGTCKHVEAVLNHLQKRRKRVFRAAAVVGSPRLEIYLDRRDNGVHLLCPSDDARQEMNAALQMITPFFASDGRLFNDPLNAIPALNRVLAKAPDAVRACIRLSYHLNHWLERLQQKAEMRQTREDWENDLAAGKRSGNFLRLPLYDYQQQGMRHLAFTERALLADEMGLGKTVQAIAASELLHQLHGVERVLIISPASLKGEWQDQIEKFTGQSSLIIAGSRAKRLQQYRQKSRYYLANYEQVRPDFAEMNEILMPDIIILDEAQRIKNWQTKTAAVVKHLNSRFAFVLTGTPIENRIDEIYSIVQFLDPSLFGPLFRFNRDFYQLEGRGRAVGYRNLDVLHRRLRSVMLRRLKHEVEGELPDRTVNNYFVPMAEEQRVRYDEYQVKVARLAHAAKRRPLTKEEQERLQQWLACMRMLCDTPYILDPECRVSPKLKELKTILSERLEDGEHKIIIFSEWVRMLELVREHLQRTGIDHAWHTGDVPLPERREEIRRFMNHAACRVFLSSDSGSVGLNLQQADTVINLDLPWNPAKLEQRIARAWRKHQTRSVQIINLVCEDSIEHRMLGLLKQKSSLANEIIDGAGTLHSMALPSGRSALIDELDTMGVLPSDSGQLHSGSSAEKPALESSEALTQDLLARWQDQFDLLELHGEGADQTLFVVTGEPADAQLQRDLQQQIAESFPKQPPQLEVIDRTTFATIQRLIQSGVLSMGAAPSKTLHRTAKAEDHSDARRRKQLAEVQKRIAASERQQRMATVLAEGGFVVEALAPLKEGVESLLHALAFLYHENRDAPVEMRFMEAVLLRDAWLTKDGLTLVACLRANIGDLAEDAASNLLRQGHELFEHVSETLSEKML